MPSLESMAGVLLASGLSRRFGGSKLSAPLSGRPLVFWAIDSLAALPGAAAARLTNFAAMVYVPRTAGTRLAQLSAVEGPYPFYGEVRTEPEAAWAALQADRHAVVDPSLLATLNARLGDTNPGTEVLSLYYSVPLQGSWLFK